MALSLSSSHTRFAPVLAEIAASAAERERERVLPFAELDALRRSGFLAARVPVALGGLGLGVADLLRLVIELGAADPNIAQILRSHFGFVEARLVSPHRSEGDRWLRRVAAGALVGNASSETGTASTTSITTTLREERGQLLLDGRKAYSTGALFADLISVFALRGDGFASLVVPRDRAGVTVLDDWDGFGQRLTGSGTTIFDGVVVEPGDVLRAEADGPSYAFPYLQLHLLGALAGIARRVRDDAIAAVPGATRTFGYRGAGAPRADPLIQARIGGLAASAAVAEACVLRVAETIDEVNDRGEDADAGPLHRIAEETAKAQVVVSRVVLDACRRFYDTGGASLLANQPNYGRHWRNARTIVSHNPAAYRARVVGDAVINRVPAPLVAP